MTAAGLRRIVLGSAVHPNASHFDGATEQPADARRLEPLRTNEGAWRSVLAIAYSEHGVFDAHARQALAAAALTADLQTEVIAVVLGELAEDLSRYGADRVLVLTDCDARDFQPEHTVARIDALLQSHLPLRVFLPDRAGGEGDLGRRLAAARGMSIATQVVEIDARRLAVRCGGSKRLARRPLTDLVLLAADSVDDDLPFVGRGEPLKAEPMAPQPSACRDGGVTSLAAASMALEEASLVAAAGNGVLDVPLFERLASALGASIGASRVAVDDGRFARDKQIGATGRTVSANLYLAIGISGAVQHLQGIKDCRHVVAVNRDSAAPIVQRADLTVVDDAQALMSALLAALRDAQAGKEQAA